MRVMEGDRTPEMRRGGHTLTVDHPGTKASLQAIELSPEHIADFRSFSNKLHRDADAWLRRGGFSERGRISKADAHRILAAAIRKEAW